MPVSMKIKLTNNSNLQGCHYLLSDSPKEKPHGALLEILAWG